MDEALKNRIVIILAVLLVVFFFGTLSSCNSAIRQKAARDKEMAARLALEERTSKYAQEKSALEEKNKAKDNELQELKADLDAAKKVLSQNEQVIQGLKEELQKVAKPKETPQENSRQASADGKKPKK